jgi:DNA-directed RNA polymerase specialized sigma24 family protein
MGSRERGADFDRFVTDTGARLLRTAYLLTGDYGAAEDLLQDVLERMYVAWPRVQTRCRTPVGRWCTGPATVGAAGAGDRRRR